MDDEERGFLEGVRILEARMSLLPTLIAEYRLQTWPAVAPPSSGTVIVTGTGSSAAHASYLAWLLNQSSSLRACVWPLSSFVADVQDFPAGSELVVISQGLSPNAQIPLRQRAKFSRTHVLTAVGEDHQSRGAFVRELVREGVCVYRFPIEDEYTTFMRVIGPVCGYLAARRLAASWSGSGWTEGVEPKNFLDDLLSQIPLSGWSRGMQIVTVSPESIFSGNLSLKLSEALFCSLPPAVDCLTVMHGYFQAIIGAGLPVLFLSGQSQHEEALWDMLSRAVRNAGLKAARLSSPSPRDTRILDFELSLNHLALALVRALKINQIAWPGKGAEDEMYAIGWPVITTMSPGSSE